MMLLYLSTMRALALSKLTYYRLPYHGSIVIIVLILDTAARASLVMHMFLFVYFIKNQ